MLPSVDRKQRSGVACSESHSETLIEIKPCQGLCSICCTPLKGSTPPCWPQGPHHHTTPTAPPSPTWLPSGPRWGRWWRNGERHAGVQGVTSAPAGVSALSSVPGAACLGLVHSPAGGGRAQASWTLFVAPRPPTKLKLPRQNPACHPPSSAPFSSRPSPSPYIPSWY